MTGPGSHVRARYRGFTMIEVLVAIVVLTLGLVGLLRALASSQKAEVEVFGRAQALVVLGDMVQRINASRVAAGQFRAASPFGHDSGRSAAFCETAAGIEREFCQIDEALLGAGEQRSGSSVGGMIGGRGCIEVIDGATDTYLVTVAWQGLVTTSAPPASVGCGTGSFGDEKMRRAVTAVVRIGNLL